MAFSIINYYQPLSTIINHYQPLSTIINHYQPLSTIINHYQPSIWGYPHLWKSLDIPGLTQRSWLHVVRTYLRPVLLLHLPWLPCWASNDACNDAPLPASSKRSAHLACQLWWSDVEISLNLLESFENSFHIISPSVRSCVWLRYLSITICTKQWFPPCFG